MYQLTKKAIIDSFIKLLNEKPFEKITVKDIVDDCGVNRNTFYYYFDDIYALLSTVFEEETKRVVSQNNIFTSWYDGFVQSIAFAFENKRAIHNLYVSLNREVLERYLYDVTDNIMLGYVKKEAEGLDASVEDMKFISDFYKYALVGLLLEWIGKDMKTDPMKDVNRISLLFEGSIRAALERSSEQKTRQND